MSRIIGDVESTPPCEDSTDHSSTAEQQELADTDDEVGQLLSVEVSPGNKKKLPKEANQRTQASQHIIE